MEKSIPELIEIHVIILRYLRNVNVPFKKDFKFAKTFTKTLFFLYFRDRPKNGLKKVNKLASKRWRKLKLI